MTRASKLLSAASLAFAMPAAPALAGGDITNFKVKNCTQERMFVCSFDKTDSLMKIPYKARGIQPGDKREFGCASLKKCKVIIGVSKKKPNRTLSEGVEMGLSAGTVLAGTVAGFSAVGAVGTSAGMTAVAGSIAPSASAMATGASTLATLTAVGAGAAVLTVAAGGTVAALEIADGWGDGEVCNQVRKAAKKAGLKPKSFMKNGKTYQAIEQYALDENGNFFINPDGSAVLTYSVEKSGRSCPQSLPTQLF
ncbi:hypothetical protein B5C34_12150 [Pacificimonas flava]|uniref:Uncharacterized protein n=2 Tax=Pacificimonas TaxID=1960290 RepID=A0A219B8Q7_9SPHN|nr:MULTISPECIES: hypothetical protein [Pacificimonas]MBZ6378583.1 hypothetical protein [Pacificimonas aurantium]OWV34138.1 hypothetical protein B5C34_12150 [Pacificimonas flava]